MAAQARYNEIQRVDALAKERERQKFTAVQANLHDSNALQECDQENNGEGGAILVTPRKKEMTAVDTTEERVKSTVGQGDAQSGNGEGRRSGHGAPRLPLWGGC